MALNAEQERRAAACLPLLPVSLKPDGIIGASDRQQIGWGYPGILALVAGTFTAVATDVYLAGQATAEVYLAGRAQAEMYLAGAAATEVRT